MSERYRRNQHAFGAGDERLLLDSAHLDDLQASSRRELAIERVMSTVREQHRPSSSWAFGLAGAVLAAGTLWFSSSPHLPIAREPSQHPGSSSDSERPILLRPACPNIVRADPTLRWIDDMEDGDANIIPGDARSGTWRLYFDGTGPMTPFAGNLFPAAIPGGRGASQRALHLTGGRLLEWGAFASASLTPAGCYDASGYAGLEFWARGTGQLRVGVVMMDVVSTLAGGPCAENCNNSHMASIELCSDWQHYALPWEQLAQQGSRSEPLKKGHIELDLQRLSAVTFGFSPNDTPFDIWLDDLAFLQR